MSDDWYARPVICVRDTQASLAFYRDRLGFAEAWRYEEEGRLLIAQVDRQGCEFILSQQWPDRAGQGLMFISLDEGVLDAAVAEFEGNGVTVEPGRWGYDLRVVTDPDGNRLMFPLPAD